jgi:hypothetical protein
MEIAILVTAVIVSAPLWFIAAAMATMAESVRKPR